MLRKRWQTCSLEPDMVQGVFIDSDKPTVPVTIAWNQAVQSPQFILDTGFTGDLVVTEQMATDLGLEVSGVSSVKAAGHDVKHYQTASAIAVMEGQQLLVTAYIIPDGWPLLGISFMEKFSYKAEVDCKHKTVSLTTV